MKLAAPDRWVLMDKEKVRDERKPKVRNATGLVPWIVTLGF